MQKIISAKNLFLTRQNKTILKGINFEMQNGQHIAVIGPNGAGKSFLLQILSADLIPSQGTVKIFNQEFGKVSLWELRKKIGFVSNRMLFWYDSNITCLETVCSGFYGTYGVPEGYTKKQASQAKKILDFFNVPYLEKRKFEVISDGERRKVLLARAIVTEPALLIFDEPCQGLDIPTREILLKDIDKLSKKKPVVYVTHHLEELPNCITDVVFLKNGLIFDQGSKNIMLTSKKISRLFNYNLNVIKKDGRFYVQHS